MSSYNLKISDTFKLLIGGGFKLFIDAISTTTGISAAKRWNGSEWVLIYDVTVESKKFNRIMHYNGSRWVNASLK